MTRFAILLGGTLTVTARLVRQVEGARVIAADSGMGHAAALGVIPELWVGDFDSTDSVLARQYPDVPRQTHPEAKDATDGSLAVAEAILRGASQIVLVGGLGGQTDHMLGNVGMLLGLARKGYSCFASSGEEEAYPLLPGDCLLDVPQGTRLSIVPFTGLEGLGVQGVRWPLVNRSVALGSTLTLSNVVTGNVSLSLKAGHAIAIAVPAASR